MKNIEFKNLPILDCNGQKYSLEIAGAIVGKVIRNKDFDDGTPNSTGEDENEFTLETEIEESDVINAYRNRQPDWSNVKTIHFDESCTIPRYKLGNFCSQKNIKVTRSKEKADIVVYGKNFKVNVVSLRINHFITTPNFLKKAASLKTNPIPQPLIDAIKACNSEMVVIDDNCDWMVPKKGQIYGEYMVLDKPDEWNDLSTQMKYCNQEVVLQDMGLETIDEFTYQRIAKMLESKDPENHRVAMEVMANSNYRTSIVYLLDLMRRYYSDPIFNTTDRQHVSFKALREYLDYEPRPTDRSLDDLIENVADRDLLTEANYKIILKLILEEENRCMGEGNEDSKYETDNNNWRILQVDLTPEYKEKIIWDKKEEPEAVITPETPIFTA